MYRQSELLAHISSIFFYFFVSLFFLVFTFITSTFLSFCFFLSTAFSRAVQPLQLHSIVIVLYLSLKLINVYCINILYLCVAKNNPSKFRIDKQKFQI